MPLGLEDDELLALIDLQERRQQRIERLRALSPMGPLSLLKASSVRPSQSPPPSYQEARARLVDKAAVGLKRTAYGGSGTRRVEKEQPSPPPYSKAILSSSKRNPAAGGHLPEPPNTRIEWAKADASNTTIGKLDSRQAHTAVRPEHTDLSLARSWTASRPTPEYIDGHPRTTDTKTVVHCQSKHAVSAEVSELAGFEYLTICTGPCDERAVSEGD